MEKLKKFFEHPSALNSMFMDRVSYVFLMIQMQTNSYNSDSFPSGLSNWREDNRFSGYERA